MEEEPNVFDSNAPVNSVLMDLASHRAAAGISPPGGEPSSVLAMWRQSNVLSPEEQETNSDNAADLAKHELEEELDKLVRAQEGLVHSGHWTSVSRHFHRWLPAGHGEQSPEAGGVAAERRRARLRLRPVGWGSGSWHLAW
jgi:hypothetical protein